MEAAVEGAKADSTLFSGMLQVQVPVCGVP